MVLMLASLGIAFLLTSCANGQPIMERVATCFQRHGWVVGKRSGSTLHFSQGADEVDVNFHNGIHAQILGDAIAMRTLRECSP
jgi:recombinational DNA repair protein (RecF pathway)